MLLVYTDQVTRRFEYTAATVFTHILSIPYRITENREEFISASVPKINYSVHRISDELFIRSHSLLSEKGIHPQSIVVFSHRSEPVFFSTESASDLPYDPFACIFYMLSRYEEYLPHAKDRHGRFEAGESLAKRENFLQKAVVNRWAAQIAEELNRRYPGLIAEKRTYRFTPTFDIDQAWFIRNKGFMRTAYGLAAGLNKLRLGMFLKKVQILTGKQPDPFDVFEYLENIHRNAGMKPAFFFHVGDYSRFDKSIRHTNKAFRKLVKQVSAFAQVGLHPSYFASERPAFLIKEKARLEEMLGQNVTLSRQHYLRFTFPETYRQLYQAGIREDFTMGYASDTGFRAGICQAFYFYDLLRDKPTDLLIHPFAAMDVTLRNYIGLNSDEAFGRVMELANETRQFGGEFMTLWHNESFSELEGWQGWTALYEQILARCK